MPYLHFPIKSSTSDPKLLQLPLILSGAPEICKTDLFGKIHLLLHIVKNDADKLQLADLPTTHLQAYGCHLKSPKQCAGAYDGEAGIMPNSGAKIFGARGLCLRMLAVMQRKPWRLCSRVGET